MDSKHWSTINKPSDRSEQRAAQINQFVGGGEQNRRPASAGSVRRSYTTSTAAVQPPTDPYLEGIRMAQVPIPQTSIIYTELS